MAIPMQGDPEKPSGKISPARDLFSEDVSALLSAIINSSDDAIVSKSLNGTIMSWNPAAEKMFGYTAEEAIGKSIRMIIPPELQAEEDYVLERIRSGNKVDHFETVRQSKDGRRLNISLTVSPVRNNEGTIIGASKTARDITVQKKLEREREEATEKLAEALAGRDEFIAVAAHELRNPLNTLTLLWRVMDRTVEHGGPGREKRLFENAQGQLNRLSALVDRLLDVTRIRSNTLDLYREDLDLSALIREAVNRFTVENPASAISLQLDSRIDGNWDRLRIDQVVTNLISNAIKYGQGKPIVIRAFRDGAEAVVIVGDEGIGICPEDRERIFDRFERVAGAEKSAGLGMGLWITKRILEAHCGNVTVESELGKGSIFTVRLPLNP